MWFPGSATIDATVDSNGTIKADGATGSVVDFAKTVTGKGSADISGGGTLEFSKAVTANINFGPSYSGTGQPLSGGGTLHLLQPGHQAGTIFDFAAGDTIALKGDWAFGSLSSASGVTDLTLKSGAGVSHTFDFAGTYSESEFAIASASGSTTIKFA